MAQSHFWLTRGGGGAKNKFEKLTHPRYNYDMQSIENVVEGVMWKQKEGVRHFATVKDDQLRSVNLSLTKFGKTRG